MVMCFGSIILIPAVRSTKESPSALRRLGTPPSIVGVSFFSQLLNETCTPGSLILLKKIQPIPWLGDAYCVSKASVLKEQLVDCVSLQGPVFANPTTQGYKNPITQE